LKRSSPGQREESYYEAVRRGRRFHFFGGKEEEGKSTSTMGFIIKDKGKVSMLTLA